MQRLLEQLRQISREVVERLDALERRSLVSVNEVEPQAPVKKGYLEEPALPVTNGRH